MSTLYLSLSLTNTELKFFFGFNASVHIKVILETNHNMVSKDNWQVKLIYRIFFTLAFNSRKQVHILFFRKIFEEIYMIYRQLYTDNFCFTLEFISLPSLGTLYQKGNSKHNTFDKVSSNIFIVERI